MRISRSVPIFLCLSALLLVLATRAEAAEPATLTGEGRYFVSSESAIIQKLFGARHVFAGGFTADLTRGELWTLEKIFKLSVRDIPAYNIAAAEDTTSGDLALFHTSPTEPKEPLVIRRSAPFEPVSWGVKLLYGETAIPPTSGGSGVKVALLDTGVQKDHPDLERRVSDCVDFTRSSVVTKTCEDKNGHGTHLAGIIAADGGGGFWGVASEAELAAYRVCNNEGLCWADDVAVAISYAVEQGANIVVLGFGGSAKSEIIESALARAEKGNVLVVAPAGSGEGGEENPVQFPAARPETIAVGAIDQALVVPAWSARGTNDGDFIIEENEIEFVAPGVDIESTWPEKEYQTLSGSSQAAAFVGGLAAKLWDGSATSTRALLQRSAIDIEPTGDDPASGFGVPVVPKE